MAMARLLTVDPAVSLMFPKGQNQVARSLNLKNNSDGFVAFKVKTTAPKSYMVRPSTGVLAKGKDVDIQIILAEKIGVEESPSHRFLVQAVEAQSETPLEREAWASFGKDELVEQRLNVVFDNNSAPEDVRPRGVGDTAQMAQTAQSGLDPTPQGLKEKYDELVAYTMSLEKSKKALESTNADLTANFKSAQSSTGKAAAGGFQLWQLILVALIAAIMGYAAK